MAFVGYSFPHSLQTSAFILAIVTPPSSLRSYCTACVRITVVKQFGNRWMLTTEGALWIPLHLDFPELGLAGVEIEEAISQRTTNPENELECFRGLDRPDDTREHADHSSLLAGSYQPWRWRRLEDAPIACRFLGNDRRDTTIEAENAAMNQGLIGEEAGIVDQEFGGKIVNPVDDDVIFAENFQRVACRQAFFIHRHGHIRVERLNLFFS